MKDIKTILKDRRIVDVKRELNSDDKIQIKLLVKVDYNNKLASVKFSRLLGWEHLSVAFEDEIPSWDVMQEMKEMFWEDDEVCFQLHPKKSEYINNNEYCLHIWRNIDEEIKTPPTILVGFRPGNEKEDREWLKKLQIELGSPLTDCEIDLLLVNNIKDEAKMMKAFEELKSKYSPIELFKASLRFM